MTRPHIIDTIVAAIAFFGVFYRAVRCWIVRRRVIVKRRRYEYQHQRMELIGAAMTKHATEHLQWYQEHKDDPLPPNPNALSHWFRLIQAAGLPVPKTIIIRGLSRAELWSMDDGARQENLINTIIPLVKSWGNEIGYPCFLRTGLSSFKHQWSKTCYLAGPDDAEKHVDNLCFSSLLNDLDCDEFVVRELLDTVWAFTAFDGMPVAREMRMFFEGGRVTGYQGYWPEDSILDPSRADWRGRLEAMQKFTDDEIARNAAMAELAGQAATLGGLCSQWSIDFLETKDRGWLLIDMADAEHSYRSPDFRPIPPKNG
jgi:hypothetical protein